MQTTIKPKLNPKQKQVVGLLLQKGILTPTAWEGSNEKRFPTKSLQVLERYGLVKETKTGWKPTAKAKSALAGAKVGKHVAQKTKARTTKKKAGRRTKG